MGSGRFAIPTLEKLLASKHKVMAVVTQADRPRGRGLRPGATPIKEFATEKGLHLYQPEDINAYEFMRELRALAPTVIVTAAYGQKLSDEILMMPKYGCLNVHASLLPRWRGPAPIPRAILAGDRVTGVTVHRLVQKMDAGPVYTTRSVDILPDETTPQLEMRLAPLGSEALIEAVDAIEAGTAKERPQDESQKTNAAKFRKEEGHVNWKKHARYIANQVRSMQPFPGAYAFHERLRLILWVVKPVSTGKRSQARPGSVTAVEPDHFRIACSDGEVAIHEIQPESKRRMTAAEFLQGHPLKVGDGLR